MGVSELFKREVRLHPERDYRIAHRAGIHPSTLSKLLNGIMRPKPGDPRVIRVGRVVGLRPDECFEGGNSD